MGAAIAEGESSSAAIGGSCAPRAVSGTENVPNYTLVVDDSEPVE